MRGRLFSYVAKRYEDGGFSGVPRFDYEIRKVFPEIRSVTSMPTDLDANDIVITDNHYSLNVPQVVRTIGVHHGCAKTHFDRDPAWRNPDTSRIVLEQTRMFSFRNRFWVSPSEWVRGEFMRHVGLPKPYAALIPHWVKRFGPVERRSGSKPVVIGDWRDSNKGAGLIAQLREACPDIEFRPLSFRQDQKEKFYLDADLYLCLSTSEGAAYAVADAEACGLPIVTTDVGWVHEFSDATVIPWENREKADFVASWIRTKLKEGRVKPSFFEAWTFDRWAEAWKTAVTAVDGTVRDTEVRIFPVKELSAEAMKSEVRPVCAKYPPGLRIVVGLAGGIGNAIFNLPLIAALRELGHSVIGYVETDYPSADLWARCSYLDRVVQVPDPIPIAEVLISGPWCPRLMHLNRSVRRYTWKQEPDYNEPEWSMLLSAARDIGWSGSRPDVSNWCSKLDRTPRWDVGIVPGCKPGELWERKKYPGMEAVAKTLLEKGLRVCVIGTERDPKVSGEDLRGRFPIGELPDVLAACRVIVGTDSGATQLGASLGVPTVVLYTATSEMKGDPVGLQVAKLVQPVSCRPCQSTARWAGCRDWICRAIPVDSVIRKVEEFLATKA
jgi:hypothetical protein